MAQRFATAKNNQINSPHHDLQIQARTSRNICRKKGNMFSPRRPNGTEHILQSRTYSRTHGRQTTIMLLLAIKAAERLFADHFDIKSAYLHEKYKHDKPVYVRQYLRFNGIMKHPGTGGQLIGNLYGSTSGGF